MANTFINFVKIIVLSEFLMNRPSFCRFSLILNIAKDTVSVAMSAMNMCDRHCQKKINLLDGIVHY
jgi:hypothetical protein